MDYSLLVDNLLEQIRLYGKLHRRSVQPFTRDKISKDYPQFLHQYDHEFIRESLLEHVGCLPIMATFLHPYLDKPVDLGKSLTMLAIHDIGELIVGDEITFHKVIEQDNSEFEAAMGLLHDDHKAIYREMDELASNEALFAKSIDKMAPDLYDYICGEDYTAARLAYQVGWAPKEVIRNIRAKKRPFMEWSSFLTKFHDELFGRFLGSFEEKIEKKEGKV